MNRQRAGVGALLLLAAALVMVVPVLLRPVLVSGTATIAPFPEPPQVGDCLRTDAVTVEVVACDLPHASEVTYRWIAEDPERFSLGTDQGCSAFADAYLDFDGSLLDHWTVRITISSAPVQAPPAERVNSRGWTVCTVAAGNGSQYPGSLRSITAVDRPSATATCIEGGATSNPVVPCERPHTGELLAMGWQIVPDPDRTATPLDANGSFDIFDRAPLPTAVASEISAQCTKVAATLLKTADPTRGGLLSVMVRTSSFSATGDGSATGVVNADCEIEAADNRRLVGTLIGLGDEPVPFQ